MSQAESIDALLQLIHGRSSFLVTSHARPDGDAIGSSLGLMHLLESLGKQVEVAFADPIPLIYRMLPGVERIHSTLPCSQPDAAILLECDSIERTGFQRIDAGITINIDHHISGKPFADFNWIQPDACAVGALIYSLAVASRARISPELATCLYTALLTDSGSFTYACTNASTFSLAEQLVEHGANASDIAQAVYFSNPPGKIRLLGAALRNLHLDGPLAWTWVTLADMTLAGAVAEDCEGIVNYLIGIAGVQAAAFLREVADGMQFRLSLRSKDTVDVARVAEAFGGGGHRNASGCTLGGPLDAAIAQIVAELRCDGHI